LTKKLSNDRFFYYYLSKSPHSRQNSPQSIFLTSQKKAGSSSKTGKIGAGNTVNLYQTKTTAMTVSGIEVSAHPPKVCFLGEESSHCEDGVIIRRLFRCLNNKSHYTNLNFIQKDVPFTDLNS
jgi:hypothetical protein